MKLFLSIFFISFLICSMTGQSFQINNVQNNLLVNTNDLFYCGSTANGEADQYYYIKNISGVSQTITVRKYDDQLNTVSPGDASEAFFCTGALCFVSSVNTTSFVLASNDSMEFKASLQEASVAGASTIRYKISNPVVPESIQWTIKYTQELPVKSNPPFHAFVSEVFPNPASSEASILIKSQSAIDNITIKILNYSGQIINSQKMSVPNEEAEVFLPISKLSPGLYFINIQSEGVNVLKKFIINY